MSSISQNKFLVLGLTYAFLIGPWSAVSSAEDAQPMSPPGSIEFIGKNLIATANGRFDSWRIVEGSVDAQSLESSWVTVEVDLSSVDTGIDRRDAHLLQADFFEVARWPKARVRVDGLSRAERAEGGGTYFDANFEIDLHGLTRLVEGEVILLSEDPLVLEGSLVLNRMDFEIGPPPSRWNPMAIKAEIPVRFRYEGE